MLAIFTDLPSLRRSWIHRFLGQDQTYFMALVYITSSANTANRHCILCHRYLPYQAPKLAAVRAALAAQTKTNRGQDLLTETSAQTGLVPKHDSC